MPIYMDLHIIPGVTAAAAAEAHRLDLAIQGEFNCTCMTYWVDEAKDSAFCLIEAPDKNSVKELHSKSHGLIPHKILEVNGTVVESFLGRIYDPDSPDTLQGQLKIFNDPAFRILVCVRSIDFGLLKHAEGAENAEKIAAFFQETVKSQTARYNGDMAEHIGDSVILSFTSVFDALQCAESLVDAFSEKEIFQLQLSIGINAGMPVSNTHSSRNLFGETIALALALLCTAQPNEIVLASIIREIAAGEFIYQNHARLRFISAEDERMIEKLIAVLGENYRQESFSVNAFSEKMNLSKSGLYRHIRELFGLSANVLLRQFRLDKALRALNHRKGDISEIAFACGFGSPSYFSKCFKSRFGLSPSAYLLPFGKIA